MQAGTCLLPDDVAVMWCIPPPNNSPSSRCPPYFRLWNWWHFFQCKRPSIWCL